MPATYIILVNWNGYRDTIECLESLARLEGERFGVIIVDNGSTDGSVEAIASWSEAPECRFDGPVWQQLPTSRTKSVSFERLCRGERSTPSTSGMPVMLVQANENLGFAGANNLGMWLATQDNDAQYLWMLNNDTVVTPNALSTLLAYARNSPRKGIIGSVLLYYSAPDRIQGLGGWLKPSRALAGQIAFGKLAACLPTEAEVDSKLAYVIGASMFVRREVYDATGGMSEEYFLYYEELDWARRLPQAYTLGVCLDSIIFHKEGGSIGTSSVGRPSDTALYYLMANTMRFYHRHERRYVPVAAARIVWSVGKFMRTGDLAALRVMATAFADIFTGRRRRGPYGSNQFRAI